MKLRADLLSKEPVTGELAPEGMRFVAVHYNTDTKTGVKAPSVFAVVPAFRPSLIGIASKEQCAAIYRMIDKMQFAAVKDWIDSQFDAESTEIVEDFEACCKEFNSDGRGEREGLKQSVIVAWIVGEFAKYLGVRMERNLPAMSKEQRGNLVATFVGLYKLAATRGNKGKDKSGAVTFVSLPKLRDLGGRLESYLNDPVIEHALEENEVTKVLRARIAGHIAVLEASLEENVGIEEQF